MIEICALRQQLIDHKGHALVTGGPGSGKTTIALKKAVVRIEKGLSAGQSVLFISFSRAAVARIIEAAKLDLPKTHQDKLSIQTFHSFFWELLRSHAYLLGTPKTLRVLLPHDERVLSNGVKEGELLWSAWLTERNRICMTEGRVAFDLFAPLAVRLLERSAHIRRLITQKYPLLIIDEAQDTNREAWRSIEMLAEGTQIICLADLEQQIFDYLPGVGPERIDAIKAALAPLMVELGSQNYRSPNTEIAVFGRDILSGYVRADPYKGISRLTYNPKTYDRVQTIRTSLGILQSAIQKATGERGRDIAILVASGPSAARLSAAMSAAESPIKHKLLFDEAEAMIAARFAAFLLEPRERFTPLECLEQALDLLSDMKRVSGAADAATIHSWALKVRSGKIPKAGLVRAVQSLLADVAAIPFSGDPARDWVHVKKALRNTGDAKLSQVARHLDYLIAFNRGKRISANLSEMWQRDGKYTSAREGLERALSQDQLLDGIADSIGLQLMNIHKAKSKQFDGVIVLREAHHDGEKLVSSFLWRGDYPPYYRSRKILHVAVTRAKVHTLILDAAWPRCPIISPHTL